MWKKINYKVVDIFNNLNIEINDATCIKYYAVKKMFMKREK